MTVLLFGLDIFYLHNIITLTYNYLSVAMNYCLLVIKRTNASIHYKNP